MKILILMMIYFDRSGSGFDFSVDDSSSDDSWNINQVINIQTADGIEQNVKIIGFSENPENIAYSI